MSERLRQAWDMMLPERRVAVFGAAALGQLPALVDQLREELRDDMAALTMPHEQDYATLLEFQEAYKDLRRERDTLNTLADLLRDTQELLRASAE